MSAPSGRRVSDIDPARLARLNAGEVAATTLTEILAIDFAALMETTVPDIGAEAVAVMRKAGAAGIVQRMRVAGGLVRNAHGPGAAFRLSAHGSDTVRGWACFAIGSEEGVTMDAHLAAIRPFADDPHFGVREWAWLAVRPHLAAELDAAIALLPEWSRDPSERIRRFASEAIRPRGVWCAHIPRLRREPEIALPILEPLRADPAAYVRDSVGNWLNDAAKDRPDWVRCLCKRWRSQSPVAPTMRICKRALRSIGANP